MVQGAAKLEGVLIGSQELHQRVVKIGRDITRDYCGKSPFLVAVLAGAAIFHADLVRQIDLNIEVDFVAVSSYGNRTKSTGKIELTMGLEGNISGLDVILVEDIVDTGLTMSYLLQVFSRLNPASLKTCALLSKPSCHEVAVPLDYLGFEIPNKFVVGYGLDYRQQYRNLPFIATLKTAEQ
jgi:hypoxanthine phosphoribosyltransferase